jgi:hypothetical protein
MNPPLIPKNILENASVEEKKLNSLKNMNFDYDAEPIWELAARVSARKLLLTNTIFRDLLAV